MLGRLDGDFRPVGARRGLDAFSPRTRMYFHWAGYDGKQICVTWNDARAVADTTSATPDWYDAFGKSVTIAFAAYDSLAEIPAAGIAGTHAGRLIGGATGTEVTPADVSVSTPRKELRFVVKWCAPSPRIASMTRYIVLYASYKNPPLGEPAESMRAKKGDWGPDVFAWQLDSAPAAMDAGE